MHPDDVAPTSAKQALARYEAALASETDAERRARIEAALALNDEQLRAMEAQIEETFGLEPGRVARDFDAWYRRDFVLPRILHHKRSVAVYPRQTTPGRAARPRRPRVTSGPRKARAPDEPSPSPDLAGLPGGAR
jgi:hypothetical protein